MPQSVCWIKMISLVPPLTDGQGTDFSRGDDTSRVPDHVSLALIQAENAIDIQSRVHACHHRNVLARRQRQWPGKGVGVGTVVGQVFVGDGHGGFYRSVADSS